jgi:hypothetical protein
MGSLVSALWRTVILDDAAYEEWRERPNVFLRGILLIIVISLVAGLIAFGVNLVNQVKPVDVAGIQEGIDQWFEMQSQFFPLFQDPEVKEMVDDMVRVIVPMVRDLAQIEAPLPRGIVGFFNAFGGWLSRALAAIGGWLFYGALVLITANLLGGTAKLPEFLGTVAVYVVPGLLGVLSPLPCIGGLLTLVGAIWSIVVYIKATSVVAKLDGGRAILAVIAPFFALILLAILLSSLFVLWFVILF